MDLKRVPEIVKEKVMEQKSCDVSTWIPSKPLHLQPASLEQVFKAPGLLNKTANIFEGVIVEKLKRGSDKVEILVACN